VPERINPLRRLGHGTVEGIWRLGFAVRFLFAVLLYSGSSFRRLHLTLREIYFSGVLSLLIILVSGLFVGLVLGLQGYDTLQRYGSSEALGILRSSGEAERALFLIDKNGVIRYIDVHDINSRPDLGPLVKAMRELK